MCLFKHKIDFLYQHLIKDFRLKVNYSICAGTDKVAAEVFEFYLMQVNEAIVVYSTVAEKRKEPVNKI